MIKIRKAIPGDEATIFELIKELALYEKEPLEVTNTASDLKQHLFEDSICHSIVATDNNQIIGFALYYISYSTWKGKCLYLEDFYVKEKYRKQGIGAQLFNETINIAKSIKAKRMDWQVLSWNELAINFYKKLGTNLDTGWINGRISFKSGYA